jgi:hypothetical protein
MARWHDKESLKPSDHMIIAADKIRRASVGNLLMFSMNVLMFVTLMIFLFGVKR